MTTSSKIDHTYMKVAKSMENLSDGLNTKVGACIVDPKKNVIVSSGSNKLPDGCNDLSSNNENSNKKMKLSLKHLYFVHAAANAIVKRGGGIEGCTLYTTLYPCNECTKLIIQSKIGQVVYLEKQSDVYDDIPLEASKRMLEKAGIPILQLI